LEESAERLTASNKSPQPPFVKGGEQEVSPFTQGGRDGKEIEKRNLLILAALVLGSLYFLSFRITGSLLLGGAIAAGNFRLLCRVVEGLIARQKGEKKGSIYPLILLKFLVLLGVIGLVVVKFPIHAFAFLIGLSSIVLAIVSEGFYARF
jgi:hypothetical protein